ncbi:hypothetical protein BGW38_000396 [Lunasporangiospora selenospora]|uniref:DSBA-like thioredoxin domain-containing protein n=1 Tax=Lunasporangiospora selenospora TaxID=979761 RepID=A0A9P6FV61_9FUNG|nr:hypothetical protein BGW38_000396 [Lunasporangiospora selenospora]
MVTFREQHRQQQLEQNQPPQEIDFDIRWYPYQLDPKAPTAATPRSKFLARKFGLDKSAHQIQDRIVQAGKVEGIQFRYDDDTLYCNTLDSHRMIELVRRRWDLEGEMVEELFQSHFERGECGDVPTLLVCARKVYLAACVQGGPLTRDASRVEQELAYLKEYLESDQGMDEVKEEIRRARQDLGLQGVPAIIVQNTYLLSGGQDPSTFVEVFKRVV